MTKKLPPWPRLLCLDCGINIFKAGDYCMLNDRIWKDKLHLKDTDNLCIKCIEDRLGRKLKFTDMGGFPRPSCCGRYRLSDILKERYLSFGMQQGKPKRTKMQRNPAR